MPHHQIGFILWHSELDRKRRGDSRENIQFEYMKIYTDCNKCDDNAKTIKPNTKLQSTDMHMGSQSLNIYIHE
jgi:uncharacterized iron-regulated protein